MEEHENLWLQRVTESSVKVDDKIIGQIGKGFMVTNWSRAGGYKRNCGQTDKKMIGLRIFEDETEKQIFHLLIWMESFYWFHSLHYMQIVKEEIVQALLNLEILH